MAVSASPQHPRRNKAPAAVTPYGLWPSPIDGEQVARQATAYDAVHTSGEAVYWLETRPSQDGRAVVVRWTDDAGAADAVPARFDVGSRGFRRPESIQRALEAELSFYLEALGLAPAKPDAHLATDGVIAAGSPDQRRGR